MKATRRLVLPGGAALVGSGRVGAKREIACRPNAGVEERPRSARAAPEYEPDKVADPKSATSELQP